MPGPLITHWTIRIALACLVVCVAVSLRRGKWGESRWERWVWTAGVLFFVAHIAAAFHFYHEWSHQRAFESTAKQTEELLGLRFGEGIYFSYLFTLLWIGDVAWWWLSPHSYRQRPAWLVGGLIAYLFFIAVNGAIVFEDGVTRPVGIVVCMALGGLLAYRYAFAARTERPSAKNVTAL